MQCDRSWGLSEQIALIRKPDLQQFILAFMEECVPDYFYVVPASSSGKYHPTYALGEGGLVRHTIAAVTIAEDLLSLEQNTLMNKTYHDEIIAALIVHDSFKQGLVGVRGQVKAHTKFEHPLIAAEALHLFAKEMHPEMLDEADLISSLVRSHMGQWNTSSYSKFVLPKPSTEVQGFVHMCDYLASRRYITVDVAYEPKTEEKQQTE